jgi:hypothetical protein
MCKRFISSASLVPLILVLALVGQAHAIEWTDGNSVDHLWSSPDNWNPSGPPGGEDEVFIYYNPAADEGPLIDATVTAECDRLKTGYVVAEGDGTVLTMTGGTLDVGSWSGHAEPENSTATMIMSGGTVTFTRTMAIGQGEGSYGVLNMTGGLIRIYGQETKDGLWVTVLDNSTGHIQLDGGRIETRQVLMHTRTTSQASIDITGGVLVVDGSPDTPSTWGPGWSVQHCIDEGWITAYGGSGQLVVEYDEILDKTTIWAYFRGMATNPSPLDVAENVCPGATLSWTPGEFCVDDHNVYFGTSLDYVSEGAEPCLPHHDTNSFTPSLELDTTYYWRIEEVNDACEASPWAGPIWQFTTGSGNAFDPSPPNGLQGVPVDATLSWTPGCGAASHTLYLGTNYDDVNDGSGGTNKGSQDPGYDPELKRFTTYYWRVEASPSLPGDIRTFRTGLGGVLMYYKFDGTQGNDILPPITDSTGNVTFTKYTDIGSVKYGESNPVINSDSGTSADFDPCAGLYRPDACDPAGWDLLRLDGYQYTIEMWLKPETLSQDHVGPDMDTWLIGKRGSWKLYINDPDPCENDTAYSWDHAGNEEQMFEDSAVEGEWTHLAAVYNQIDESERRMRFYLNGGLEESSGETGLNPADNNNMVTIGMQELADGNFTGFFDGLIDELRVLDVALTPCEFLVVPGLEWASCPSPPDKEEGVDPCEPGLALSWTPGIYADKHNIYFGTSLDDVNDSADPCVTNHDTNSWTPPTLEFGTIYYWRVDEVNDSCQPGQPWQGVIWQFMTKYEIVDPNLLVWYKFDETSGDDVFDWSGHGQDGDTDDMDDEDWEPNNGHIDGCLSFDGGGRVDVPPETTIPIDSQITVSVWVNGGDSTGDNWVFSTGFPAVGDSVVEAAVPTAGDTVSWRAGNDSNDVLEWEEANPQAWRGEWHHFAFLKDEDANTMIIYFDGLAVREKSGISLETLVRAKNREFNIGARYNEDDGYVGKVDDFRVYDYALSEDEIAKLYRGADLGAAWFPTPYDGKIDVPYDANLIWRPGNWVADTNGHDLYLGTDWDEVNDANSTDHPSVEYYNLDVNTYDIPYLLELGQTYYWRVDELNDVCQPEPWRGKVWRFNVADYIVIDDMEDYTATKDYPIAKKPDATTWGWDDIWVNFTGAILGLVTPTEYAWVPAHNGDQAMYYYYINTPDGWYYSEISNHEPLEPNDWTMAEVKMLTLWFYGDSTNSEPNANVQMYVGLEDTDTTYAEVRYTLEDMDDILAEEWQEWNIPLSDFTSVNLESVQKLYIGFGDRTNNSQFGGLGSVAFDDIRLYPPTCVLSERSAAFAELDLNDDCIISFGDVEIMAGDWLDADVNFPVVEEPCDANLVGWWQLDEGDGNLAGDSSGYDYNGVIETIDTDVWWVPGRNDVNYALDFDGGRVLVADDGNTPELRPLHQVSVCAWIKVFVAQSEGARIVVKGANNKETFSLELGDEGRVVFNVRDGNDPNLADYPKYAAESAQKYEVGYDEWTHAAGTFDGNTVKVYVNGQVGGAIGGFIGGVGGGQDANGPAFLSQNTSGLAIGNRSDATNRAFEGIIDDVRVYNYGLSAQEIAHIATDGGGLFPVQSIANLVNDEPLGERVVNFKDFDKLADEWLKEEMYP